MSKQVFEVTLSKWTYISSLWPRDIVRKHGIYTQSMSVCLSVHLSATFHYILNHLQTVNPWWQHCDFNFMVPIKTSLCLASYVGYKCDTARICCWAPCRAAACAAPVLRRFCCWAPAARCCQSSAGPTAANPPQAAATAKDGTDRQTDRPTDRTDGHRIVT